MNLKSAVVATLLVAGTLGAGVAQARPDIDWSVRIGLPLPPLPVIVLPAPAPVVVQPAPVYRAPVVVEREVYYRDDRGDRREWRDDDEWRERHHRHHHGYYDRYDRPARWDVDGDGVPNRYDRRPYDPRRY